MRGNRAQWLVHIRRDVHLNQMVHFVFYCLILMKLYLGNSINTALQNRASYEAAGIVHQEHATFVIQVGHIKNVAEHVWAQKANLLRIILVMKFAEFHGCGFADFEGDHVLLLFATEPFFF